MKAILLTTIICFVLLLSTTAQTDQELVYASYFGGEGFEIVYDIAIDFQGNIYLAGFTNSETGISTEGAYQEEYNGGNGDGFIAKFDSDYNLLWSTYFGGENFEWILGISVLTDGSFIITGNTNSEFDIATMGAYQEDYGGGEDAFLSKFSAEGVLVWSTYFGGNDNDVGNSLVIVNDSIYFAGRARSAGMATSGAFQEVQAGSNDGFIASFSSSGELFWSTYYGGPSSDFFNEINITDQNELVLLGRTQSETNIATTNVYQETYNGGIDCFITKFTLAGERVWGTYYGGPGIEQAYGIDSDNSGNIIVSGYTGSSTGIATPGAHKTTKEFVDDFLASFTPDGQINWGTYVGGERGESDGNGVFLKDSDIYFTGRTDSENGIVTGSPYQVEYAGPYEPEFFNSDIYLTKFNSSGQQLWGTYYGSSGFDYVEKMIMIDNNTVALAGYTNSTEGVTTPDALNDELNGFADGLLAVFDVDLLTGIIELDKPALQVFPNPASGYFIINLPSTIAANGLVEIYSLEGKRMMVFENYSSGNRIPIDLSPGMYVVNYRVGELKLRAKLLVQ